MKTIASPMIKITILMPLFFMGALSVGAVDTDSSDHAVGSGAVSGCFPSTIRQKFISHENDSLNRKIQITPQLIELSTLGFGFNFPVHGIDKTSGKLQTTVNLSSVLSGFDESFVTISQKMASIEVIDSEVEFRQSLVELRAFAESTSSSLIKNISEVLLSSLVLKGDLNIFSVNGEAIKSTKYRLAIAAAQFGEANVFDSLLDIGFYSQVSDLGVITQRLVTEKVVYSKFRGPKCINEETCLFVSEKRESVNEVLAEEPLANIITEFFKDNEMNVVSERESNSINLNLCQ